MNDDLEGMGSAPELHFKWVVSGPCDCLAPRCSVAECCHSLLSQPLFSACHVLQTRFMSCTWRGCIFYHFVDFYNQSAVVNKLLSSALGT